MYSGYPKGTRTTPMGFEFRPQSIGASIRRAYQKTGLPVLVTENGVPTDDDRERIEYISGAMKSLSNCIDDGIPVKGYMHWSLLDNFEWNKGFKMHFGLIAVDRETFRRVPKPSAHYLGEIARQNAISS